MTHAITISCPCPEPGEVCRLDFDCGRCKLRTPGCRGVDHSNLCDACAAEVSEPSLEARRDAVIVGFKPPAALASLVEADPDIPPHVTLLYFPRMGFRIGMVEKFMRRHAPAVGPLLVDFGEVGHFDNDAKRMTTAYLTVRGSDLHGARDYLAAMAKKARMSPSERHSTFRPHLTLSRLPLGGRRLHRAEVVTHAVSSFFVWGRGVEIEIPLC